MVVLHPETPHCPTIHLPLLKVPVLQARPPLTLSSGAAGGVQLSSAHAGSVAAGNIRKLHSRDLKSRQPTTMALLLARRMACVELVETIHGFGRGGAGREGGEQGEDGKDLLHTILLSGWAG